MNKVFEHGLNVLITVLDKLPKKKEETVNNDYEHCRNTEIYQLRNAKLDEKLMYQLAPFIIANRPQTPITKWQELKQEFGPPKDRIAPMNFKEIVNQSNEMNRKFVIGSKWWM